MIRHALVAGLVTISLVACSTPDTVKRWQELEPPQLNSGELKARGFSDQPSVAVFSYPTPDAPAAKLGLKDLSDRGQAALIEQVFDDQKTASKAIPLLAAPLSSPDERTDSVDRTSLKRTVVIALHDAINALPGDRIAKADIRITPKSTPGQAQDFIFASYTVAADEAKQLPVAHLDQKVTRNVTGKIDPAFGAGQKSTLDVEASQESVNEATSDLVQTYIAASPDMSPREVVLHKRGERNADVTGNTVIALTVQSASLDDVQSAFLGSEAKLFDDAGQALPPSDAALKLKRLVTLRQCPLQVEMTTAYQIRTILEGRQYYSEGKQKAKLDVQVSEPSLRTLVPAEQAAPAIFGVQVSLGRNSYWVYLEAPAGERNRLVFDTPSEARIFAAWMTATSAKTVGKDGSKLWIGSKPLPPHPLAWMVRANDACQASKPLP